MNFKANNIVLYELEALYTETEENIRLGKI